MCFSVFHLYMTITFGNIVKFSPFALGLSVTGLSKAALPLATCTFHTFTFCDDVHCAQFHYLAAPYYVIAGTKDEGAR